MSLYYEAADILTGPDSGRGGSLKNRIFSKQDLKSPPAQVYRLVIESCKWSSVLKDVIENTELLKLEHKLTPLLALYLVHDLLIARKGIALPATHGLRTCVEKHKARLQAELTKARVKRHMGSMEALTEHVESGGDNTSGETIAPHPRWIRINTIRTSLQQQLDTTFKGFATTSSVDQVRQRGVKCIHIDQHIPNLVAIPASHDLTKSDAYINGAIIFQDKASCFPAYLLNPTPQDGDVADTCAAPGNKTTHTAAIMAGHAKSSNHVNQKLFAFEKNKIRAETLKRMVTLAGSDKFTLVHGGHDFLKVDSKADKYKKVGALLLDPSCSGSGIVGRDEMPELHLADPKAAGPKKWQDKNVYKARPKSKTKANTKDEVSEPSKKRKREDEDDGMETFIDDDGDVTAITSGEDLQKRLTALSQFQLTLLLHAMTFPSARKITYSTCSIHFEENENVVLQALDSAIARGRGWRILKRSEQVDGMKKWPVRGIISGREATDDVVEGCIRANKGDGHGTMGFFLAGFVRDGETEADAATFAAVKAERDALAAKAREAATAADKEKDVEPSSKRQKGVTSEEDDDEEVAWSGFEEEEEEPMKPTQNKGQKPKLAKGQAVPTFKPAQKPKASSRPPPKKKNDDVKEKKNGAIANTSSVSTSKTNDKTKSVSAAKTASETKSTSKPEGVKAKETSGPKPIKAPRPAGQARPNLLSGGKKGKGRK